YAGFKKRLPEDVSDVLVSLPRKARAAARQGRKKFSLTISYGIQHLPAVYQLYADSMHRLASLNYPYQFFEELHTSFKNDMWVSLVRWDDRPVAGLITFAFRDTVMPYFVGLSDNARQCHAANFIYLCTMERAVARGYSYFDFGRSRIDNTGSYNFKRFHGFEPRTLGYQFHTMPGNRPVSLSASSSRFSIARKLWTWCPRVVTKRLGARLAYHLPG
ncbi:MAG: GNAT family N-acetyltransferase, partial [Phycisphaerae bacterium]